MTISRAAARGRERTRRFAFQCQRVTLPDVARYLPHTHESWHAHLDLTDGDSLNLKFFPPSREWFFVCPSCGKMRRSLYRYGDVPFGCTMCNRVRGDDLHEILQWLNKTSALALGCVSDKLPNADALRLKIQHSYEATIAAFTERHIASTDSRPTFIYGRHAQAPRLPVKDIDAIDDLSPTDADDVSEDMRVGHTHGAIVDTYSHGDKWMLKRDPLRKPRSKRMRGQRRKRNVP